MRGREYLTLAREIISGGSERHWRGTVGRAYYALMLECREALIRWGFTIPKGEGAHRFVRLRFDIPGQADLRFIAAQYNELGQLRNRADYDLSALPEFKNASKAKAALPKAADALAMLDAIEADSVRLAAAIAAIRAAYP